jgi:hypothetical protein
MRGFHAGCPLTVTRHDLKLAAQHNPGYQPIKFGVSTGVFLYCCQLSVRLGPPLLIAQPQALPAWTLLVSSISTCVLWILKLALRGGLSLRPLSPHEDCPLCPLFSHGVFSRCY